MRISDWSSDVCSSDLPPQPPTIANPPQPEPSKKTESAEKPSSVEKETVKKEAKAEPSKTAAVTNRQGYKVQIGSMRSEAAARKQWQVQSAKHKDLLGDLTLDIDRAEIPRSEEHTSELQSLMRSSYAVFCLKK